MQRFFLVVALVLGLALGCDDSADTSGGTPDVPTGQPGMFPGRQGL